MELIASGENVLPAGVVGGRVQRFASVDDVLAFLDNESQGVVALTPFAGSTFLSPILENLVAIVTIAGTRTGHLAIVSREFRIPCVLQTQITGELDGREIVLDARDESVARIYLCPTSLLVALRIQGPSTRADLEKVMERSSVSTLGDALSLLEAVGYVEARSGEPRRYALARAGLGALQRCLEADRRAAGTETLDRIYERFEPLDAEFKAVATDCENEDPETPETDAGVDARVRERLASVHARIGVVLDELGASIARYRVYRERLAGALASFEAGNRQALIGSDNDAHRVIWVQMREDLLLLTDRKGAQ